MGATSTVDTSCVIVLTKDVTGSRVRRMHVTVAVGHGRQSPPREEWLKPLILEAHVSDTLQREGCSDAYGGSPSPVDEAAVRPGRPTPCPCSLPNATRIGIGHFKGS